eukprot:14159913-Heterocapsa_arctica.AAC.1
MEALARRLPFHKISGSFCWNPAAGGVITAISGRLARSFDNIDSEDLFRGRCVMTTAVGRKGKLIIINLHLFGMTDTQTDGLFDVIARRMGDFDASTSLLLGDFNFSAKGEARMNRNDAR